MYPKYLNMMLTSLIWTTCPVVRCFYYHLEVKDFPQNLKFSLAQNFLEKLNQLLSLKLIKKNITLQSGREGAMGCTVFITLVPKVL